jgi:hypothetical protein
MSEQRRNQEIKVIVGLTLPRPAAENPTTPLHFGCAALDAEGRGRAWPSGGAMSGRLGIVPVDALSMESWPLPP